MREIAEKDNLNEVIENLMKLALYMLNVNEMRYKLKFVFVFFFIIPGFINIDK